MHEHGGRLIEAARLYKIPLAQWLDLSTGINPLPYPVKPMPETVWHRLPEDDDDLLDAAESYYRTKSLLPTAGSQAALKLLPRLRKRTGVVGILFPSYSEHEQAWLEAGHEIKLIAAQTQEQAVSQINNLLDEIDVLIISNPNNPTGIVFSREDLLKWHEILATKEGWLIVDEAFIDTSPEKSLIDLAGARGLVVLRSLGKFFGLAGARVGFVFAPRDFLETMNMQLGPWTISGPSRHAALQALRDHDWQTKARQTLLLAAERLADLLTNHGFTIDGSTEYFHWFKHSYSAELHQYLAEQAILTRLFQEPLSLRIGLPGREEDWNKLENALTGLKLKNWKIAQDFETIENSSLPCTNAK